MTRILVVILTLLLLNTCDLTQTTPRVTKKTVTPHVAVWPNTKAPDSRFTGEYCSRDMMGANMIRFNGTNYINVRKLWLWDVRANWYFSDLYRYLTIDPVASTIRIDSREGESFGYTYMEFTFKTVKYSFNADNSILTIDGHEYKAGNDVRYTDAYN